MLIENKTYTDKTSLLIENQFPAYVRDNPKYANFIAFVKTYYEWAEEHPEFENGINQKFNFVDVSHNLLNYNDIDRTEDAYIDYYMQDFMPDFPTDCLADKRKLIKIARTLYQNRGIPDSYKFVFRALYDEDVELYNHYNLVFKPSNNIWIQSKKIIVNSSDSRWLDMVGYTLFGKVSGGYGVISDVQQSIEDENLYLISIEKIIRKFQNGEELTVVNDLFSPVILDDKRNPTIEGVIVSELLSLDIVDGGTSYRVGDPLIVVGGLNENISESRPATIRVSKVSEASINAVRIINTGSGYHETTTTPVGSDDTNEIKSDNLSYTFKTDIKFNNEGSGSGALLVASVFDEDKTRQVDNVFIDLIESYLDVPLANINFGTMFRGNPVNDGEDIICELLHKASFKTKGISFIRVENSGSKYSADTEIVPVTSFSVTDIVTNNTSEFTIPELGILGEIEIVNGGSGYSVGDIFKINGGSGEGAYIIVSSTTSNGTITKVDWTSLDGEFYPKGGIYYLESELEEISGNIDPYIINGSGESARFNIISILGKSCVTKPVSSTYGQVEEIDVLDYGFGYSSIPAIASDVRDILIDGDFDGCSRGYTVYQGSPEEMSFVGVFDSFVEPATGYKAIRCYNCSGTIVPNEKLYWMYDIYEMDSDIICRVLNYTSTPSSTIQYYTNGVRIYGNGQAYITAEITDGVSNDYGYFKNSNSLPSTPAQRIQSEVYNDYTYRLVASSPYEDYKDSVLKLLHPSGTAVYPIMKSTDNKNITVGYSNVTFIETDAIAEVSYSDDGKLIVTIYGPASLDIENTRINFYRNGKIVYVAQLTAPPTEEQESDVKVSEFSIVSTSTVSISGTKIEYNKTVIEIDFDLSQKIDNIMYVKLTESINDKGNTMYIQKIPSAYAIVTGRKAFKISDVLVIGEKIEYYGKTYIVTDINDIEKYIRVNRVDVNDAKATAIVYNGSVDSIVIDNPGSDYLYPPDVVISRPDISVAKAKTKCEGGKVSIEIIDSGNGYTSVPNVIIDKPSVYPARATATINNQSQISGIDLETVLDEDNSDVIANYGYTSVPNVHISAPDGIKTYEQATAEAVVENGKVTQVLITNAGKGYTKPPVITIDPPTEYPVLAEAVIENNKLKEIRITNENDYSYYTYPPNITIDSPIIDNATALAVIDTDTANNTYGQIVSISDIYGGSMYNSELPPSVSFVRQEEGIIKLYDTDPSIKNISTNSEYPHIFFFDFTTDIENAIAINNGEFTISGYYSLDTLINEEGVYDAIYFDGYTYHITEIERVMMPLPDEEGIIHNTHIGYKVHVNEHIQSLDRENIKIRRIRSEGYISLINSLVGTEVKIENSK